ncbi:MAG TPA: glucoamylase family protein, partial [Pyrinomonadaceae bacterium]|nr:glucoamylase family protein [Pyrinomonadaceae bacterium]
MSEFFGSLSAKFGKAFNYADEQPLRAEIFSVERLEHYARLLGQEHKTVVSKKGRAELLPRLEDNGRKLIAGYRTLIASIKEGHAISPAAEWLIDNFHIVEEQLREIREDLPRSYYHELPKLAEGELKLYPRIYAVAVALIAHTDCRLDTETLRRYIAAYQSSAPLTIGELWAIAIMLRLALVENLRRLALAMIKAREQREEADKLADKLLELSQRQPSALVAQISERMGKREKLPKAFVVQLVQRLREQDPNIAPVMQWLEEQLGRKRLTVEEVIHLEHQRQAATQVTVGNIITSMRLLSTLDWRDFFESVSLIEPVLGEDPSGAYRSMEFATRDRYRHVIERISKRTRAGELDVARTAVDLAKNAAKESTTGASEDRKAHVGYYLVDAGLHQLETTYGYRPEFVERLRRFFLRHATATYLGALAWLTLLIIGLLSSLMYSAGASWLVLLAAALLAVVPATDLAVSVLNWDVTHFFPPRLLPRMNIAAGVPRHACTMVVVPSILSTESQINELVERLEVHFLANHDKEIYFALLGDFPDADAEEMPEDASLRDAALNAIAQLNQRYATGNAARFHLFHRRRLWNPSEEKWMGWERKRGKLEEFNHLVRGTGETTFVVQTADDALLRRIRYVITLDSDTQLPRDAALKLIGAAIHPLNRPRFDNEANRVVDGYGILQPRVSISLESASRSRFANIFSGNTGIDPYTTAVSDVYQDLFGEGSFTGKGLYDVNAFETALAERVPENSLLSHDLFESLFARAALVTDIELIDDYPSSYIAYSRRQHRWTRGDWQIFRWLFPVVPDARRNKIPNPLPLIGRWKIFDNLRRSMVAPALFLWLMAAWTIFPGSAFLWTLFAVAVIAFPVYLHITTSLLIHPRGIPWTSHFWSVWGDVRTNTAQFAVTVLLLPHQAYLMVDAIVRTIFRKVFSRKKLLEWMTAADAERTAVQNLPGFILFMWPAAFLAAVALITSAVIKPSALPVVAVFGIAWILSPAVAYWVSIIRPHVRKTIDAGDISFARAIARRTWRFFETFVGAEDNWLPPDNFQEDPVPVVAHRTSPTNIGLLGLATVAARDLGYVSMLEFVERLELTTATVRKLTKFHGHLFNWYDTQSLEPLTPQYISTVDSGNLAAHFLALRQACIELPDHKLFDENAVAGLRDTIEAMSAEAEKLGLARQRTEVVAVSELRNAIEACRHSLDVPVGDRLSSWYQLFAALQRLTSDIEDIVNALAHEHGEPSFNELRWWVRALYHQLESFLRDADVLLPWGRWFSAGNQSTAPGFTDRLEKLLLTVPVVADIPEICDSALVELSASQAEHAGAFDGLTRTLEQAAAATTDLMSRATRLAQQVGQIVEQMDFGFLFDSERKLFPIGYNISSLQADNSYYDLLASEARVASFMAIAKGDVPQEHWFRMGRQLTQINGGRALISWTGTMFEYLMPLLTMRNYPGTLLDETYRTVVHRQIEYGEERGVPWGISESAYNVRDINLNYQYGPFGVPGLGLKRGLIEDLVVAPYATMLAAHINPRAAVTNLRR